MKQRIVNMLTILLATVILTGCTKETLPAITETYGIEENSIEGWKESLQEKSETKINGMAIRGLEVVKGEDIVFAVSYEPRKYKNTYDCWAISRPYESLTYTNTEAMYELFKEIGNLVFEESSQKTGEFQKTAELMIAYNSRQTGDTGEASPDAIMSIAFGNTQNGKIQVKINDENQVYETDAQAVSKILDLDPYQYILQVVSVVDIDSVSKLELGWGDGYSCLESKEGKYYFNQKETEFDKYNELYTNAMSIFIADKLREEVSIDDLKCILTMKYTRNTEEAPDILIKYYAYKNDKLVVTVNGNAFFTVEKEDIDALISTWK